MKAKTGQLQHGDLETSIIQDRYEPMGPNNSVSDHGVFFFFFFFFSLVNCNINAGKSMQKLYVPTFRSQLRDGVVACFSAAHVPHDKRHDISTEYIAKRNISFMTWSGGEGDKRLNLGPIPQFDHYKSICLAFSIFLVLPKKFYWHYNRHTN